MSLRADAARNREQIVAAAKRMFTEYGPDVPMEDIAREAGVGVGTLYRRFPDRGALISGVMRENLEVVLSEARSAAEEELTGWGAVVRIIRASEELRLSVQLGMVYASPRQVLLEDSDALAMRDELVTLIDGLVRAAQDEGTLRADIGTGDIIMLTSMLIGRHRHEWSSNPMATERATAIMLDGLRQDSELPGHPLGPDVFRPKPAAEPEVRR